MMLVLTLTNHNLGSGEFQLQGAASHLNPRPHTFTHSSRNTVETPLCFKAKRWK